MPITFRPADGLLILLPCRISTFLHSTYSFFTPPIPRYDHGSRHSFGFAFSFSCRYETSLVNWERIVCANVC